MWMVIFHLEDPMAALLPSLNGFVNVTVGVKFRMDLLFILSGFLTSYVYLSRAGKLTPAAYRDFLRWRVVRLYPSCVVILLLSALLANLGKFMHIRLSHDYPWVDFFLNLAMLQAWPYVMTRVTTYNSGLWFLSALWFAYLFVGPIAWRLVQSVSGSWRNFLWVFVPLAVWLIMSQIAALHEFHMLCRACCGFLCGSALFLLYADSSRFITSAQRHMDKTLIVFLALSVLVPLLPVGAARVAVNALLVLGCPFLVAGATAVTSVTAKLLTKAPLIWLGNISYSLFLSHNLCIKFLIRVLPASAFSQDSLVIRLLIVLAYAGLILAVAVAFYRLVELPCAAALKRFVRRPESALSKPRELASATPAPLA